MTARTARWWIVLAGAVAVLVATLSGSLLAEWAAAMLCFALLFLLVRLDKQRGYRRTRR